MPTTLEDIRNSVRLELRDPSGAIHDDDDIDDAVRKAYVKVFTHIRRYNKDYFVTTDEFTSVADTDTYELPDNHRRTKSLELVTENGEKIPLHQYVRGSGIGYTTDAASSASQGPYTYDFIDASFIFTPPPAENIDFLHTYYHGPTLLEDEATEIDTTFEKQEWIDTVVLEAARTLFGRVEATGGYVSPDIKSRLKEQYEIINSDLNLRTLSPRRQRRKGYFE